MIPKMQSKSERHNLIVNESFFKIKTEYSAIRIGCNRKITNASETAINRIAN